VTRRSAKKPAPKPKPKTVTRRSAKKPAPKPKTYRTTKRSRAQLVADAKRALAAAKKKRGDKAKRRASLRKAVALAVEASRGASPKARKRERKKPKPTRARQAKAHAELRGALAADIRAAMKALQTPAPKHGPAPHVAAVYIGEASDSQSHTEARYFATGDAFLGYVEGRPGVQGVLAIYPRTPRDPARERVAPPPAVVERVNALPPVVEARTLEAAGERERGFADRLVRDFCDWWDDIGDDGALVEAEVSYGEGDQ